MIATTSDRVRANTTDENNQRIDLETDRSIARHAKGGRQAIQQRLAELDEEWDVERYLETMASTFTLVGLSLGITRSRKWLVLPVAIQSFFLLHALQGWCPPLPVLRRLGIRTADEINRERYALKALLAECDDLTTSREMQAVEF